MSTVEAAPRAAGTTRLGQASASAPPPPPTQRAPRPATSHSADLPLSVLGAAMLFTGIFVLVGPISIGEWMIQSLFLIIVVFGSGYVFRRMRMHQGLAILAQWIVTAAAWMFTTNSSNALLGIIPTERTFTNIDRLANQAYGEILYGVAPMQPSVAFGFILVTATAVLALLIELLVVELRWPLVGAVIVLAIGLIPPLIVPGDVNLNALVLTIIVILLVVRRVTSLKERSTDPRAQRVGPATTAAVIGVASLVLTVGLAPLVEGPRTQIIPGFGPALSISPSLDLGSDLRQPRETEVLTFSTNMLKAPYLRISTLTQFDGRTWVPDDYSAQGPIDAFSTEPVVGLAPDVRVTEYETKITSESLRMQWVPLPYPAMSVEGLDGNWVAYPESRTIEAADGSTSAGGQDYSVVSREVRPSAEQMRAATTDSEEFAELAIVPEGTPQKVSDLAREVTAGATNDYDRLVALQTWFRSSEFRYSLEAPVEDGFDGDSMAAIDRFLDVKAGYCAHYAATFTLMARTLAMPSRIVVGFLPGDSTGEVDGDMREYSVTSGKLHAWPEVYFDDIGWVPFEPTQSLGTPTSFAASQPDDAGGTEVGATPPPAEAPELPEENEPSAVPSASAAPGSTTPAINWWPILGGFALVMLVLLIPAGIRVLVRQSRIAAARSGSAPAAWRELNAIAIDYGKTLPPEMTPRDVGELMVKRGAPATDMATLVAAIERASYSNGPSWQADAGPAMASAVAGVRAGVRADAPRSIRVLTALAPRSLVALPAASLLARGERQERERV